MPTNVTTEYLLAEREYHNAKTREERIIALEKMISHCPKHKGTENLLKTLKERLAKLRKEQEATRKKGRSEGISKEGAAQVVVLGYTNTGKSLLIKNLTNADPKISEYPFTTTKPLPGMIDYDGAKIQIIDTPSLLHYSEDKNGERNRAILGIARNADILILIARTKQELLELLSLVESYGFKINKKKPDIIIRKNPKGVSIIGEELVKENDRILRILQDMGIKNIEIIVKEPCSIEDILLVLNQNIRFIDAILLVNNPGCKEINREGDIIILDINNPQHLEVLKREIWERLGLVRIYTKEPGQEPKMDIPVVIKKGDTLREVAQQLHKDFVEKFRYARIWGKSSKFPGQKVGIDHIPMDKDIVEIHIK